MQGLRVYRGLLANGPLTRLLLGEFISGIGDWLYIVAIFVVIYRESQDAALVGAFGAVRLVPYVVLSIPAGVLADRFDRRLVLLGSDLVRGSLMLVLAWLVATNGPTLAIVAVAILAACGSTFFYPAMGAYLPSLVKDERQLGPANSAWASLGNVSFIIGPAIGGLLIAAGGVTLAFVLNAATFAVIAAMLWTLPSSRPGVKVAEPSEASVDPVTEAAAGAREVPTTEGPVAPSASTSDPIAPGASSPGLPRRPLAGLGVIQLIVGFVDGGIQVLTVVLAIDVLKAGEQANGYLNAAIGVGGLIGAIAAGGLVLRRGLGLPLFVGAMVVAVGIAVLGAVPILVVALAAIAVAAAGSLIVDVVLTTIFQRLVPDELRGRGVGILMAVTTLSAAAGAFSLPVLVTRVGAGPTLGVAGLAIVVATAVGLFLIGGAATRAPNPFEATLARVSKLPIFAGVPAARLEAALGQLRAVPVTAGQTIIRQGDPADRFYIVQAGTFEVTQQRTPEVTPVTLRTMGPDEVFGELGLLREAPRTATVTATTDGTLLELDGPDFLALVGASGALRGRLLGLYVPATSAGSG